MCVSENHTNATASHPYDVLKPSVVLQHIFVIADCFRMVTAEIAIAVLHPLSYLT